VRLALPTRFSTLQVALGVSVAFHGALLGVRFADPEGFNRLFEDSPLEVVLVNSRSGEAPEKAQAIAQASLAGGGEAAAGRATSPLPPSALTEVGDANEETRKQIEQLQQTQQQVDRDRKDQRDQAAQPSGASTQQQTSRPGDTAPSQKTGQAPDQSNRQTSSATVNDDQRRQVVDQLRRDRAATSQNLNIQVNVGTRLPQNVQARRLPSDIVRIMPQYRDYEYTVIDNRVAIVDPRGREVVEILDDGPGYGGMAAYGRDRIVISDDTRTRFRELVRSSSTTVGSTSPSGGGTSASNCLSLQPVPEELARTHPELSSYRYLAVGDQVVLVDPQQQKIVQVID